MQNEIRQKKYGYYTYVTSRGKEVLFCEIWESQPTSNLFIL